MEIERECGFRKLVSFILDSGIEVEMTVTGTYIVKSYIEPKSWDTPFSWEYDVTSADVEDVEIESVFSDDDEDPSHYKLTDQEYARLKREFWSMAEQDFKDRDIDFD